MSDSDVGAAREPAGAGAVPIRTPKIALHIGEALIDIIAEGDAREEFVGGSPANTAMGVARLGHRARLLTSLGRDARGQRIAEMLEREAVDLLPGSWSAKRTSTALARIAADGGASYDFDLEWRLPRHGNAAAGGGVRDLELGAPDLVHAGSIALFLEPGGSDVLALLTALAAGAIVTVDPNIRPALVGEHGAALERFEAAVRVADLVKLSDEDAAWLYPEADPAAVATQLHERGPSVVVVTLGADGALAATQAGVTRIRAVPVEVADTISAGDSFMASLIASLLELGTAGVERELPSVLARAAHAAAIAVSQPGANPPRRAALDAALDATLGAARDAQLDATLRVGPDVGPDAALD